MSVPGSRSALLALLLTATLAAGCASSASIAQLRSNPSRYHDRTVTVTGVVTSAWGVPLVPFRMYRISDGQSEILVVSDGERIPTRGARVRVRGRVEDVAVLGGRPVGLHLREKSLKIL